MSALDKLNFLISTYGRLFIALFNPRLWPPFLIYLLVMVLLVLVIVSMYAPLLSSWVIPLTVFVANENALHFPQHLAYLPFVFERFNLVPSLLLESLLTTAAVLMFAAYFRKEKISFSKSLRDAAHYYPKILLVWLVNFILVYLLFISLPELFHDFTDGSPRRQIAMSVGMKGLSVLLTSLFVYVIPYLVIQKRSLGTSFTGSFNLFFRNFFITYFFVAIPQFVILPLILILQNTGSIVGKFNPQILVLLTYILIFCVTLVNFFTTGSILRFFLETSDD